MMLHASCPSWLQEKRLLQLLLASSTGRTRFGEMCQRMSSKPLETKVRLLLPGCKRSSNISPILALELRVRRHSQRCWRCSSTWMDVLQGSPLRPFLLQCSRSRMPGRPTSRSTGSVPLTLTMRRGAGQGFLLVSSVCVWISLDS